MKHSFTSRKRIRKDFGNIASVTSLPNLIEVQKKSYDKFLQSDVKAKDRTNIGLEAVLKSVFPISDFSDTATLEFISYDLISPKYDIDECRQRGVSYSAPLRGMLRLIVWLVDEDTGAKEIKDIKEQEVYMGDIPLMTPNGTFVINGTERVIVSQMHRSPGVFFGHDKGKTHSSGTLLYSARIIPYRGSWFDFEFDHKNILFSRIDRRRKLPATVILKAIGMNNEEILSTYYDTVSYKKIKKGWSVPFLPENWFGTVLEEDLKDTKGAVVAKSGEKLTPRKAKKLAKDGLKNILLDSDKLSGNYIATDIANATTGEIYAEAGEELTPAIVIALEEAEIKEISVLLVDKNKYGAELINTLKVDKTDDTNEALKEIYKVMRPGEAVTPEVAAELLHNMFFNSDRYDLSDVGRMKLNSRLNLENKDDTLTVLRKEDIVEVIRTLLNIKNGNGVIDDIDNLGNRRVRSVGELVENQFRIGLIRMERAIIDRMGSVEIDTVMPHDLVNAKPLTSVIKEFFGSSQLSQFMDQTNPLAEITHKRRLSALGPGGLNRERAGFEVRDVHPTHYGRICPIETPEGPNIGLISSMATYATINKYGFIETPYRKIVNNKVTDKVEYLSAIEEEKYTTAQANAPLDDEGKFTNDLVSCRQNGEFTMVKPDEVNYMDVSPKQLVSVAAALIPFLENDDANRALMGSNMQRQAVSLLKPEAPLVGTGMERIVAEDSGVTIVAKRTGTVIQVDASRIVIQTDEEEGKTVEVDIYNLLKFRRSNQNTCINQRPIVKVGDKVNSGDIMADASSTDLGELALGRNVLVAFMPWNGYNFEDSILVSERIVKDDVFTSVHIEEFDIVARDTKLGPEEITRDIPNVGEENLRFLDETGIISTGAEVKVGDVLVGKVTPKSESPMTPEEKLLRAIFGEKAADVRDTSLRVPPGVEGIVVDVRVFSRRGVEKDERALYIEKHEIEALEKNKIDEQKVIEGNIYGQLEKLLIGKKVVSGVKDLKKGTDITDENLHAISKGEWWQINVDKKTMSIIETLNKQLDEAINDVNKRFEEKVVKIRNEDDMPTGVLKVVKVFVAVKRRLQAGDKMAGRHGNKGVVSLILPEEDMPYSEDGTPVDVVLNPLGVPSRMNIGQILETHLGWASRGLGLQIKDMLEEYQENNKTVDDLKEQISSCYHKDEDKEEIAKMTQDEVIELAHNLKKGVPMATPVFDGAKEKDIDELLEKAGLDKSGQVTLYDGRTGEEFDRKITVGYLYILKLHHLVDDKIHARSIGPYSLVTQQPLGGKSMFGGQRFGEMECWALQAYGAAHTLQELLTVKSDDVFGRTRVYESIVRGDHTFEAGVPESFNVIVKELRSLCLNVELTEKD